jgi:hypothetical protein
MFRKQKGWLKECQANLVADSTKMLVSMELDNLCRPLNTNSCVIRLNTQPRHGINFNAVLSRMDELNQRAKMPSSLSPLTEISRDRLCASNRYLCIPLSRPFAILLLQKDLVPVSLSPDTPISLPHQPVRPRPLHDPLRPEPIPPPPRPPLSCRRPCRFRRRRCGHRASHHSVASPPQQQPPAQVQQQTPAGPPPPPPTPPFTILRQESIWTWV